MLVTFTKLKIYAHTIYVRYFRRQVFFGTKFIRFEKLRENEYATFSNF